MPRGVRSDWGSVTEVERGRRYRLRYWAETPEGYEDLVVGPRDPPVDVLGTVVWWQAYEDVTR